MNKVDLYKSSRDKAAELLPVSLGGTGEDTPKEARQALRMVVAELLDRPAGLGVLGEDGLIPEDQLPGELKNRSTVLSNTVQGPTSLQVGEVGTYKITDYSSFVNYNPKGVLGTATLVKDVLTYTAGTQPGQGGFFVNGRLVTVEITKRRPSKPVILVPVHQSIDQLDTLTVQSSAFAMTSGSDTHLSTDWELFSDLGLVSPDRISVNDKTNLTTYPVTGLAQNTTYYVRCRHRGTLTGTSDWSEPSTFKTKEHFYLKPTSLTLTVPPLASIRVKIDGPTPLDQIYSANAVVPVPADADRIRVLGIGGRGGELMNFGKPYAAATGGSFSWVPYSEAMIKGDDGALLPTYAVPTPPPTALGQVNPATSSPATKFRGLKNKAGEWRNFEARFTAPKVGDPVLVWVFIAGNWGGDAGSMHPPPSPPGYPPSYLGERVQLSGDEGPDQVNSWAVYEGRYSTSANYELQWVISGTVSSQSPPFEQASPQSKTPTVEGQKICILTHVSSYMVFTATKIDKSKAVNGWKNIASGTEFSESDPGTRWPNFPSNPKLYDGSLVYGTPVFWAGAESGGGNGWYTPFTSYMYLFDHYIDQGQAYVAPSLSYTYGVSATVQATPGSLYTFPGSYGDEDPNPHSFIVY